MPYCFKPRHHVARDAHDIINRQLSLAVARLERVHGRRADDLSVHEARRHLKKIIAVLRLVTPQLDGVQPDAVSRMKLASGMLAPVADAEALVSAATCLSEGPGPRLDAHDAAAVRRRLLENQARIDRRAALNRVFAKVIHLVDRERLALEHWGMREQGFDALRPGLLSTLRRAHHAGERVDVHPTNAEYHRWRRRVKDVWLQLRLLERRCGSGIETDRKRFGSLDALLGEHHNLVLLAQALRAEPCLSREGTAVALRLIHRRSIAVRRETTALARLAFAEKPPEFVERIERLWHRHHPPAEGHGTGSCLPA